MFKREPLNREQAYNYALRLLNQRMYSTHTLKQKLAWRGTNPEDIDAIIVKLTSLRFLDDKHYAEALTRSEATYRHASPRKIALKLKQKGISEALIKQTTTTENDDLPSELARAHKQAARYAGRLKPDTPQAMRQKLAAYLYRHGFSSSVIHTVVQKRKQNSEPNL